MAKGRTWTSASTEQRWPGTSPPSTRQTGSSQPGEPSGKRLMFLAAVLTSPLPPPILVPCPLEFCLQLSLPEI